MITVHGKLFRDLIQNENKDVEEQSGFRTVRSCTGQHLLHEASY